MKLFLFGSAKIYNDSQARVAFPTRRVEQLLVYLWLHRERPQPRMTLATALWPESSERKARQSLRNAIYSLRTTLKLADLSDDCVLVSRTTAQFNPSVVCWVDVQSFRDLIAPRYGLDVGVRIKRLEEAITLYRGPFLETCYLDWCLREREQLESEYLEALGELIRRHVQNGAINTAIDYARQLLKIRPLSEAIHRQLASLYYLAGDTASAARQLDTLGDMLRVELDSSPEPDTERLRSCIMGRAPSHEVKELGELGGSRQAGVLPEPPSSFVGRESEITTILQRLSESRLLTLTGVGGCGKTRLALEASARLKDRFEDGIQWVHFGSLSDPDLVAETLALRLGMAEQPGSRAVQALLEQLAHRQMLLVWDDCEHVLAGCKTIVNALLEGCAQLRILVTSRETLGIAGETVFKVPPLSLPDPRAPFDVQSAGQYEAIKLFVVRAKAVQSQFTLDDASLRAIARICTKLDGLPLAIELAAARVGYLSLDEIESRLNSRFGLLTAEISTSIPNHQTLEAAMDWSYRLLPEAEQSLLEQLSVFQGGFSLEAVSSVCLARRDDNADVVDQLGRLASKSLVNTAQVGGCARYSLLNIVRDYAYKKLVEKKAEQRTRSEHLAFFLAFAEEAEGYFWGPEEKEWFKKLQLEYENLWAAMEWVEQNGLFDYGDRFVAALWYFWLLRGYLDKTRSWIGSMLSRSPGQNSPHRAKALMAAGWLAWQQSDFNEAEEWLYQSIAIWDKLIGVSQDEMAYRGMSVLGLGIIASFRGENSRARGLLESSLESWRQFGPKRWIGPALFHLGNLELMQGNYDRATQVFEEALHHNRKIKDKFGVPACLGSLGIAARLLGNHERAEALLEESLFAYQQLGDDRTHLYPHILENLGVVAERQGDANRAARLHRDALSVRWDLMEKQGIAASLERLAQLSKTQGDSVRAASLLGAAVALREAVGAPVPPAEREDYDRCLTEIHAQLEPTAFEVAWVKGQALSLKEVVDFALAEAR